MPNDRVSLRADDALIALSLLQSLIERLDDLIATLPPEDDEYHDMIDTRRQRLQAYHRIAKALKIKPTLSTPNLSEISDNGARP